MSTLKKILDLLYNEIPCLLGSLILMLTYLPVIWFKYGFSDDYYYLYQIISGDNSFKSNITLGRPITEYTTKLVFGLIENIDQLHYLRLINVIGIGLMGMVLYLLFRSFNITKTFSLTL